MRDRWHERSGGEAEAAARLDVEAGLLDRRLGVAGEMAAARDVWPEGRVGQALDAAAERVVGDHVLVEAQLATGADHATQLGEGLLLVGDRAEDERGDPGVEGCVPGGDPGCHAVDHLDGDGGLGGRLERRLAQHRLGLDGEHALDRLGVEGEVEAVARADLDHLAGEPGEQLAAVLALGARGGAHVDPREEGVVDLLDCVGHRSMPRYPSTVASRDGRERQEPLMGRRAYGPLPPGPRAPAAVNTARLVQRPMESLLGWRERYGDVFTVPLLVFGTGVYVSDLDGIREMLTGDQSDLHAGEANAPLAPVLGDKSVLILDGREHLRQRRLLLPPFQGSAVQSFRTTIREVADAEVSRWREGDRFAVRDRMRALTFEVIVRAVFGVTDPDRIERLRRALVAVIDTNPVLVLPRVMQRDLGRWSPWGRFQRRLRAADALLYAEIDRRRSEPDLDERTDVLSLLLRARDEDDQPMTDVELRDELMTLLLAGHETTATGLAFAFDLLGRSPRVLARLRDELEGGDDGYLDAVVTETLRLRPVIDAAERTLTKPRTIAGWDLPAGIRVYPAIAIVHHRADLYPQPDEFRPERFVEEQAESYAWLPFGGGIRRCIGAALAQAEMAEVIRTVVTHVDLQPTRPEPDPVVLRGITLVPRHGVPVVVRRHSRTHDGTVTAAGRQSG